MTASTRFVGFEPTDEQRQIGDAAREIAEREVAPHIAGWDKAHAFPRDLYAKLTAAGLMGMLVPGSGRRRNRRHRLGPLDDL